MSLSNNELIFLKPATDDGLALLKGSVKVNVEGGLNAAQAIRLLELPEFRITNPANQSRGSGLVVNNPEFDPIVCRTVVDKSTPMAFNCCVTGANIGDVNIYHVMATGTNATVLKVITLQNVFLVKWGLVCSMQMDQQTGNPIIASYTFVCDSVTQVRTKFDDQLGATGKSGIEASRLKGTATTAGGK